MATENTTEVISILALVVSALAFAVSGLTAWLTLLRRGTVKMTQPTMMFFGPDGRSASEPGPQKFFLRTLLFSTSKRGRIVENMYVVLSTANSSHTFGVWAYGERNELVRGSGLFVGETGVEANHHFVLPKDANSFRILPGRLQVEIYAHLLGDRMPTLLFSQPLKISSESSDAVAKRGASLFFDWVADERKYVEQLDDPTIIWEKFAKLNSKL